MTTVCIAHERLKLSFVVWSAVKALQQRMEASHHRFIISVPEEPVMIEADHGQLTHELLGLITDAMRYSEPGLPIWITARRNGAEAILSVRDSVRDSEFTVCLPVAG